MESLDNNRLGCVWVVDDDESVRKALGRMLTSHGFSVETFSSGNEAAGRGNLGDVTCLVLDIAMPGENGLQVYARMQKSGCHAPAVFITAAGTDWQLSRAEQAGSVIRKPFDNNVLLKAVANAVAGVGSNSANV